LKQSQFYTQFEKALAMACSTHIPERLDQDVDRNEPEFKALVVKHGARLREK